MGGVRGAAPRLSEGVIHFAAINANGDFQDDADFEYRDYRLTIAHCDTSATMSFLGAPPQQGFNNVIANVVGRF